MATLYSANTLQRNVWRVTDANGVLCCGMLTDVTEAPPRLLTVPQAAEYLQVSIDTVRRWCRTGMLRCIALGDRAGYRIRQDDLDQFLRERGS